MAHILGTGLSIMIEATEQLERYGWWINELESLGLSIKKTNEFNDLKEMRSLTQIIKQTIYLDYKAGTNNLRHQINIV
jgi:hypothetical protein